MQADCCAEMQGPSAVMPAVQIEAVTALPALIRMETMPSVVASAVVGVGHAECPPGLHAPPPVLRI
jgi:hypothetical protein